MSQTSSPFTELLIGVDRSAGEPLVVQVEHRLRELIRDGALSPGIRLPSTRALADELDLSRGVVVDAYTRLADQGYLVLHSRARPTVAQIQRRKTVHVPIAPPESPRFDFRPSVPDVSAFPRDAWSRSLRRAVAELPDADLHYGDPAGVESLRTALADYLGRVRGVVAEPGQVVITNGFTQSLALICGAVGDGGARICVEDPTNPESLAAIRRAGHIPVPVPVDEHGLVTDELAGSAADVVVVTPAHQHPTGAVLSGPRRAELLTWLREGDRIAVEDDYDAEYRYDRTPVGSLQGLDPAGVLYAGSASKTLAPALRLGWLVVPPDMVREVSDEKLRADMGSARIEQRAFADFLERGEYDRHLRRMRIVYRGRRDALVESLCAALPDARILGVAAGLHVTVELPVEVDEHRVASEARQRGIDLRTLVDYTTQRTAHPPTLMLGYGRLREATIPSGVDALVQAIRAART